MRTIKATALATGAGLAMVLTACSDSPVAPSARNVNVAAPSFALIQQPTNYPTNPNTITVCSANASASFSVSFDNNLGTKGGSLQGSGPYTLNVAAGACETIWSKSSPTTTPADDITTATVVQTGQAAGYQFQMVEAGGELNAAGAANNATKTATLKANAFHGATATFTQELLPPPPPPAVCDFSTFGGFVLENNYNISYGGNAGRVKDGYAYGDLEFNNHTTGDKIHVWNVTDYGHPTSGPLSNYPDSRFAFGMGEINGSGSFPVEFRFVDLGEPGTSDRVWLKVNGVVLIQEQVVQGGNIQLHDICKKAPTAEKH